MYTVVDAWTNGARGVNCQDMVDRWTPDVLIILLALLSVYIPMLLWISNDVD